MIALYIILGILGGLAALTLISLCLNVVVVVIGTKLFKFFGLDFKEYFGRRRDNR